jgi:lipopolysaccharide transport system permease protein
VTRLIAIFTHFPLIRQLVRREILGRYRGATLGILWSLLTPLLTLGIYTFVFGSIFHTKWAPPKIEGSTTAATSLTTTGEFAIILFIGMLVFGVFSEVIVRAPSIILNNATYVKKIVFPLEVLVPVSMVTALFHAGLSLLVLFAAMLFQSGTIPLTALWLPIILVPYLALILGISWLLASLGVYLRDISQLIPSAMNILMFISPIFFPSSAIPEWIRGWLYLNPLVLPIEQARNVLFWGRNPDFKALAIYSVIAAAIAVFGYQWFQRTRKGFADVL